MLLYAFGLQTLVKLIIAKPGDRLDTFHHDRRSLQWQMTGFVNDALVVLV